MMPFQTRGTKIISPPELYEQVFGSQQSLPILVCPVSAKVIHKIIMENDVAVEAQVPLCAFWIPNMHTHHNLAVVSGKLCCQTSITNVVWAQDASK